MGKYAVIPSIEGDDSNEILMAKCLNTIANELAEANRLKRLEMQEHAERVIGMTSEYCDDLNEELEDKA